MNLPENFWVGVVGSVIFGFLGIFLLLFGFKLIDWMLPKIDFQETLKQNPISVAMVIAAFFIAVSHIISSVVH
jgi:uncharacterized membrane protein YjfL (UPF0719 family)